MVMFHSVRLFVFGSDVDRVHVDRGQVKEMPTG